MVKYGHPAASLLEVCLSSDGVTTCTGPDLVMQQVCILCYFIYGAGWECSQASSEELDHGSESWGVLWPARPKWCWQGNLLLLQL